VPIGLSLIGDRLIQINFPAYGPQSIYRGGDQDTGEDGGQEERKESSLGMWANVGKWRVEKIILNLAKVRFLVSNVGLYVGIASKICQN